MIIFLILFGLLIYLFFTHVSRITPRIIHQTAPADKSKWKDIWFTCQESWKKHFPDWEYKMWTDEDIDEFMKTEFPDFYRDYFSKFEKNIMKIDAFRYFVLYKYGGLYADMDYECKMNFENKLDANKVNLSEVDNPLVPDEKCQNSLMVSSKGHSFWKHVFENMKLKFNNGTKEVLYLTGPRMLTEVMHNFPNDVELLPWNEFNEKPCTYACHHYTASWI